MSTLATDTAPVPASRKLSTKAAGVVGIAVMCSRVLGLTRDLILNALFNSAILSTFIFAFRVPNLLRDLFAEGALSTAFVTTFSKTSETDGDAAAWRLANKVGTLTFVVMGVITVLGVLFSEQLVHLMGSGFTEEDASRTAQLTAVMFPFILLVSLAAQVMGMLNAKHVFGWPAMASSFFNIGSILGGVPLAWWIDPHFGPNALLGLAIGTLIGGFLQLAVQLPVLWKVGYRPRLDFRWNDPGVKMVLMIMGPAVIAASAVQVNVMVNSSFATYCAPGAINWLNNAFRLMQLPLGLFGVAIGTVTLPLLARTVAAKDYVGFRQSLARGMRLAFVLTIPSSVGLILLAHYIIGLLYQRGASTPNDTAQAAGALQFYAIGLVAYSGIKVLVPAFYAVDKRKTPMMVSFASILVNLGLNWLFTFRFGMGHKGLALSTGCVALTNFLVLYILMRRETKLLETTAMLRTFGKLIVPTLLLAGVCWGAQLTILQGWPAYGLGLRLGSLFTTIAAGGGAFFVAAMLLRVEELEDVSGFVRRKLGRVARR